MTQIHAYLSFNGNCREAMCFYRDCLEGELTLQTIEGSPFEPLCPAAMKGSILHSALVKDQLLIMASDIIGPDGYVMGNNMALSLDCSCEEELHKYFSRLSEGGKIIDPVKRRFWGAVFGACTDKFGIRWMLNCTIKTNDQVRATGYELSNN